MRWTKAKAEDYLLECIGKIPAPWWIEYRGPSIRKVLDVLARTATGYRIPKKRPLYKITLGHDGMPDPFAFLAYCLDVGYVGEQVPYWYIEKIRTNGWAPELFNPWNPMFEGRATPTDDPIEFHRWVRTTIRNTLTDEDDRGMGDPHNKFYNAVRDSIVIQRVTQEGIEWELLEDISKDPAELRLQFEGGQANHHGTPQAPFHSHIRDREEAETHIEHTDPQPPTPLGQPEKLGWPAGDTTEPRPATKRSRPAQHHDLSPQVESGVSTVSQRSHQEHKIENAGTRSRHESTSRAGKRAWRDAFVEALGGVADDASANGGMVDHQARIDAIIAKGKSLDEEEGRIGRERDDLDAVDSELATRRRKLEDEEREAKLRRKDLDKRCGDYYDRKKAFTTWKDEALRKLEVVKAAEASLSAFLEKRAF